MQSFWGFYISISLALIAFFGNARRSNRLAILMSIAFVGFAIVNCDGMTKIAKERQALFELLESTSEVSNSLPKPAPGNTLADLVSVSKPPKPIGVMAFHIAADFGVLAALWLLTLKPS